MRSKRRSLSMFGALAVAVVLLLPAVAQAQPAIPSAVTTSDVEWNSVKVMWTWEIGSGTDAETFDVVYEQQDAGVVFTAGAAMSMSVDAGDAEAAGDNMYSATVSDLKPGKRYIIAVRGVDEDDARGGLTTPTDGDSVIMTLAAPEPERVADIMVEAGDMMLMVSWSKTFPTTGNETGLSIKEYHLQYRTTQTADASAGDWTPKEDGGMTIMGMEEATISNLMNGTSYDVRVRAENNAGAKGEYSRVTEDTRGTPMAAMTPTPALPLFGAFGLGVGLLAAGRAHLRRRREQRQLTR